MKISLLLAALALPVCLSAGLIVDTEDITNSADLGVGVSTCSTGAATAIAGGFSMSSNGAACFAYTSGWSFADNGQWDPPFGTVGDESGKTTITIDLGGLYSKVWGFIDYAVSCGTDSCDYNGDGAYNDPVITALDINHNVIESFDIGGYEYGSTDEFDFDAGRVFGISESTPDIAYFQIGGDGIAAHDLAFSGETPEPSTAALLGLALALLLLAGRQAIIKDCPRFPHLR